MIPKTCHAMVLSSPSPNAVLKLVRNHVVRKPAPHEVVVAVDACAVAYRDVLDRTGAFPFIKKDAVLGHEFAGTVVSAGMNTSSLSVGDRVVSLHWDQQEAWPSPLTRKSAVNSFLGLTADGGYSEFCTIGEGALVKTPPGWSAVDAAPVMSTFGTIWQGAKVRAQLTSDDVVLVTGASGGVGSASIQLCKAMGCKKIIATTSSSDNIDYLQTLGADHVIVVDRDQPISFHRDPSIFDHGGVNVVLENVGGPTFLSSLKALAPEGRLVLVGNVLNDTIPLPLGLCILNSLKIVGSDSIAASELEHLFTFLTKNNVRPNVDDILPLEKVMDAHKQLEQATTTGRVVLKVSENNWV